MEALLTIANHRAALRPPSDRILTTPARASTQLHVSLRLVVFFTGEAKLHQAAGAESTKLPGSCTRAPRVIRRIFGNLPH